MIKYIEDVTPEYNPTMESLIDSTDDDWGNIETNRENLVPYGIPPIDKALYGMDVVNAIRQGDMMDTVTVEEIAA